MEQKDIKESIFIKILELGYNSTEKGLSFDEAIKHLDIDLSNKIFEINLVVWFYSNFYNQHFEPKVLGLNSTISTKLLLNTHTYKDLKQYNSTTSFMKGDALNKYIDYLELRNARVNSLNASNYSKKAIRISIYSLIIASIATLFQVIFGFTNKQNDNASNNIVNTYYRNETKQISLDSVVTSPRTKVIKKTHLNDNVHHNNSKKD
jgi:hypothetical protein